VKEQKRKKLCILGTAPSWQQAPFEDDSFDIWAPTGLLALVKDDVEKPRRISRFFEVHPWYEVRSMLPLLGLLEDIDIPVYMQDVIPEVPASVKFPYEEVKQAFHLDTMGPNVYVTNTITWMILLGIYEGYTDFAVFGVHMEHESEYAYQRSSCSWALGIIHGKILAGLPYSLHIADESALLKAEYEYGYGQPTKLMMEMDLRRKRLQAGVESVDGQMMALQQSRWRTEGAVEECSYWHDKIMGYK
jgi:hypothetical protein